MKKVIFYSALVGIIMLFALNANATTLTGIATLDGSTTQVGLTNGAGDKVIYYIPLSGSSGVYGDNNYGTSSDSAPAPLLGPAMDMFLYFDIGVGNKGVALDFWFKDLDLAPDNDPTGFFETLAIIDADTNINGLYDDWADFDNLAIGSTRTQFGTGNNYSVVIDDLNITSLTGDFWLHLQFYALSTFTNGTWTNIREKIRVRMDTETATAPVPEPGTIALLGIGLAGLAGVGARRRLKKKAVDKS